MVTHNKTEAPSGVSSASCHAVSPTLCLPCSGSLVNTDQHPAHLESASRVQQQSHRSRRTRQERLWPSCAPRRLAHSSKRLSSLGSALGARLCTTVRRCPGRQRWAAAGSAQRGMHRERGAQGRLAPVRGLQLAVGQHLVAVGQMRCAREAFQVQAAAVFLQTRANTPCM